MLSENNRSWVDAGVSPPSVLYPSLWTRAQGKSLGIPELIAYLAEKVGSIFGVDLGDLSASRFQCKILPGHALALRTVGQPDTMYGRSNMKNMGSRKGSHMKWDCRGKMAVV